MLCSNCVLSHYLSLTSPHGLSKTRLLPLSKHEPRLFFEVYDGICFLRQNLKCLIIINFFTSVLKRISCVVLPLEKCFTARKTILSFPNVLKIWSFQNNYTRTWSFLYYQERWVFFFPKIWTYSLNGKWSIMFLKKYMEIRYFLYSW